MTSVQELIEKYNSTPKRSTRRRSREVSHEDTPSCDTSFELDDLNLPTSDNQEPTTTFKIDDEDDFEAPSATASPASKSADNDTQVFVFDDEDDFDSQYSTRDSKPREDGVATNADGRALITSMAQRDDDGNDSGVPGNDDEEFTFDTSLDDEEDSSDEAFDFPAARRETPAPRVENPAQTLASEKDAARDFAPSTMTFHEESKNTSDADDAENPALDKNAVLSIINSELPSPSPHYGWLTAAGTALFFPLGAPALHASLDTFRHAYNGDADLSASASKRAVALGTFALVFGIVFWSVVSIYVLKPSLLDSLFSTLGLS